MMGETAGLPLPSTSAAPAALAATPATGAAATRTAAVATAQDAAALPATDAGLLFDLLLGGQPEAAAMTLPGALPVAARAAADERQDDAPAADPLLTVLAQMPQVTPLPAAPTPPPVADTVVAATTAATLRPFALPAAGPGQILPLTDIATPASAEFSVAAASVSADTLPDAALPAAPALRFPPAQQGFAPPAAEGALQAFAAPVAEHAAAPFEAAAPAALNAVQSIAAVQPASTPAAAVATPVLSQPADPANGYDDGFSGHVAWLAGQRIGQAEIRVVPEHLGAIDIRLQLDGSNVRAEFHSTQPEVRQALEASLPRLRDMLGQHGLQLAHAGVGQGQGGQRQSGDGMPQPGQGGGLTLPDEVGSPLPPDFRRARGLLDVYA